MIGDWLCNNATLQGSSTIPLTTTIDSPSSNFLQDDLTIWATEIQNGLSIVTYNDFQPN